MAPPRSEEMWECLGYIGVIAEIDVSENEMAFWYFGWCMRVALCMGVVRCDDVVQPLFIYSGGELHVFVTHLCERAN